MVSKTYWKSSIDSFLKLVKGVNEIKSVEIMGRTFQVLPNVFSPVYSSDTSWFAEKIVPLVKNKKFLEIGSGTGSIACLAALGGALEVTATDINPDAIKNIQLNAQSHSLQIVVKMGSVFQPIDRHASYDIIFWNHPFFADNRAEEDVLAASVYDHEYRNLKQFFSQGRRHLENDGQLILGTSNVARINMIKEMAQEEGYASSLLHKVVVPVYKDKKIKMDLRIYSFKKTL